MMRSLLIATVSSLALVSGAFAADLPTMKGPVPFVPPPAPMFTWTGFYIGVNGGYGGNRFVYPFSVGPIPGTAISANGNASLTSGGFVGGGQIGYNYQMAGTNYVFGVEADADATSIRGQLGFNAEVPPFIAANGQAGSHINYIGTVRGRLGYALFDRFMPYITGGFAYGSVSAYGNIAAAAGPFAFATGASKTSTRTGWTAGAGVEYAITPNWTFKTEYLYVDLGQNALLNTTFLRVPVYIGQKTTAHIVRAGINYKFDFMAPPTPVVAKY